MPRMQQARAQLPLAPPRADQAAESQHATAAAAAVLMPRARPLPLTAEAPSEAPPPEAPNAPLAELPPPAPPVSKGSLEATPEAASEPSPALRRWPGLTEPAPAEQPEWPLRSEVAETGAQGRAPGPLGAEL